MPIVVVPICPAYRRDGNLDSRTVNGTATTFQYDADGDDEDDSDLLTGLSGPLSAWIDWDLNGNMMTLPLGEPNSLQWNWDNKLRSAEIGDVTAPVCQDGCSGGLSRPYLTVCQKGCRRDRGDWLK